MKNEALKLSRRPGDLKYVYVEAACRHPALVWNHLGEGWSISVNRLYNQRRRWVTIGKGRTLLRAYRMALRTKKVVL